jgi:hypothetical protein
MFLAANDGNIVSMVNPRVLAEFFGGEVVSVVNEIVTIAGTTKGGAPVELEFGFNSPMAKINGAEMDIATYSGSAAGGQVIAQIVGDRIYVPLRFMTKAFGYEENLTWDSASRTATIAY